MSDNASSNVNPDPVVPEPKSNSVAYDTYSKVLSQRKADQAKLKDLQEAHNALLAEKQSAEEVAKAEQGKFQELFESEQKRSEELQANINQRIVQDVNRTKEQALRAELKGLRKDEYLKFADLSAVVIDDNGVVDPESVKEVASIFRESYADLISQSASLPNNAPGKGPQSLTYEAWSKLPGKEKAARSHEVKD